MKKTMLFMAAILLVACNSNKVENTLENEAWAEVADSTGVYDVYTYEGNIKAHDGSADAHYMVVITEQLDSVTSTYTMTRTYMVADTVKNRVQKSRGKKFTHWGLPGDHQAKVYILAPDSGSADSVYLYIETDSTVIMLDKIKQKPTDSHKYRLKKKK